MNKTGGTIDRMNGVKDEGKTLVETVYATLRREILDGTFEPGAKLRTEELRTRYNMGGSTIR